MKIICTKYINQDGPGATYNGKRLTKGVVELVNGNELLNRIYVDSYGHTNYEGDNWSDKYYDEFIVSPTEHYRKDGRIAPIALKEKKHWFESGDLTQDQLKSGKARDTALATIHAFIDSVCEENASTIKDYYKDKFKDAKADYEKELAKLYDEMKGELNHLLPYAKLNDRDFRGFSSPKCVYGRAKQFANKMSANDAVIKINGIYLELIDLGYDKSYEDVKYYKNQRYYLESALDYNTWKSRLKNVITKLSSFDDDPKRQIEVKEILENTDFNK